MSSLTDQYTKNKSDSEKRAFEKLVVKEMDGSISELSAIQLVLAKERENKNKGGRVGLANGSGGISMLNTPAQNRAINNARRFAANTELESPRERIRQKMRGMGKSGFQTQPGTLNQGTQRIQNIVMNQAPNRFADYLSGRTEPVTDLSEIASTQSTRDVINQGILGSLERNQITNPTGSFNTVVQSKGGGGEYASNRPVDYSGYKLGNPLPGIKNYAAEVGQVLNTMGGNAENQIANTLGDYSFEYRPPSYDFDDDYMGIKDIYDFKGKSGEGGGTPYDVNVELTDADTKQKIREQLFKDAAEPSAMPQGSPGQLNPTMADVAGPAATGGGVPNYQGGTMVGPNLYLGPTGIYERIEPNGSYTSMGRTDPRTYEQRRFYKKSAEDDPRPGIKYDDEGNVVFDYDASYVYSPNDGEYGSYFDSYIRPGENETNLASGGRVRMASGGIAKILGL